MYHVPGGLLLRAATQPADLDIPPWPDLAGDVQPDIARKWLTTVWSREPLAHAITVASPDLAAQVERILAGQPAEPRQIRRAVVATARYLLRITGRCARSASSPASPRSPPALWQMRAGARTTRL